MEERPLQTYCRLQINKEETKIEIGLGKWYSTHRRSIQSHSCHHWTMKSEDPKPTIGKSRDTARGNQSPPNRTALRGREEKDELSHRD